MPMAGFMVVVMLVSVDIDRNRAIDIEDEREGDVKGGGTYLGEGRPRCCL